MVGPVAEHKPVPVGGEDEGVDGVVKGVQMLGETLSNFVANIINVNLQQ